MDEGIVLIGGKQAFAAAGRTQDEEGVRHWRRAASARQQGLLGETGSPAVMSRKLALMTSAISPAERPSRQKPSGKAPAGGDRPRASASASLRGGDVLFQRQGQPGPLAQHGPGDEYADQLAAAALDDARWRMRRLSIRAMAVWRKSSAATRGNRAAQQPVDGTRQGASPIAGDRDAARRVRS